MPADLITLELNTSVHMSFRWLPPGEFRMGSRGWNSVEEPPHWVRLSGFYMGITPVTQEQFAVWTEQLGIDHKNKFPERPQHPAENLDWFQASRFCDWLNTMHVAAIPTGFAAALPSEAQWEYASRLMRDAADKPRAVETEYYTGDGAAALDVAGWYRDNSADSPQPVGQKQPTDFGLYDLHGNVWEWCRDDWDPDAYKRHEDGVLDPEVSMPRERGSEHGLRVMRGGGWFNSPANCRAAFRDRGGPGFRFWGLGFRVCLLSGPCAEQSVKGAASEPGTEDAAWRDDTRESPVRGGDAATVDLSRSNLPSRSDGKNM
jgi:formylglycine-generating enzyme required for sulfatase activity